MTHEIEKQLAALETQLHARHRAKFLAMSAGERARFVKTLRPEQRKAHVRIMRDPAARVDPERAKLRAEMDLRMGLVPHAGSISREAHQLRASALGSAPLGSTSGGRSNSAKPASTSRSTPTQRRITSHSPHASEMDARMGTRVTSPSVYREGSSLVFRN